MQTLPDRINRPILQRNLREYPSPPIPINKKTGYKFQQNQLHRESLTLSSKVNIDPYFKQQCDRQDRSISVRQHPFHRSLQQHNPKRRSNGIVATPRSPNHQIGK